MRRMTQRRMTQRRDLRRVIAFVLFLVLIPSLRPSLTGAQRPTAPPKRPRLVLLIVVDQFRYDYLERFGDLFGPNGFRRLMRDGALWAQANYDHFPTYTAPGHGTMMTGAYPESSATSGSIARAENASAVFQTSPSNCSAAAIRPKAQRAHAN